MTQHPGRTLCRRHPAREFFRREFGRNAFQFALRNLALVDQPLADLRQGRSDQPASTLFGASLECHQSADSQKVSGQIIHGRNGIELGAGLANRKQQALAPGDAADCLHSRIKAAPSGPGAGMAEGGKADRDDAGAKLGQLIRRESARCDRAGAIALAENVGFTHQAAQLLDVCRLPQVELCGQLAMSRFEVLSANVRQMCSGCL